jgi:hypothetical protein
MKFSSEDANFTLSDVSRMSLKELASAGLIEQINYEDYPRYNLSGDIVRTEGGFMVDLNVGKLRSMFGTDDGMWDTYIRLDLNGLGIKPNAGICSIVKQNLGNLSNGDIEEYSNTINSEISEEIESYIKVEVCDGKDPKFRCNVWIHGSFITN